MVYKVSFLLNNVKDGVGRLQMRVQWDGNMLKYNLGYAVNADRWDADIQMCRNNSFHGKKKVSAAEINKEIRRYKSAVETASLGLPPNESPERDKFKRLLDIALGKTSGVDSAAIYSVVTDFVTHESRNRQWAGVGNYRSLRSAIEKWKEDATLADLDADGLESFYNYLVDKRYRNVTIKNMVVALKAVLSWAEKTGRYDVAPAYKDFSPRIKIVDKPVVWLTWEEVIRLYDADLSGFGYGSPSVRDEIRDMFCLSCFTGMRWSDIHKLRHSDIRDGKIYLSVQKTGASVVIDLNKRAKTILGRYQDRDPVFAMPRHANTKCNYCIRQICRHLYMIAPTTTVYYTGSKKVEETKPKYEFVSMHTGRRSFVCNALEKGISPQVIIQWTGHASLEELKPYIAISDKAKASAMKLFDE